MGIEFTNAERAAFWIADRCNRIFKRPFMLWNACFMYALIWIGLSRRLHVKGLENIAELTPQSSVLIASNHRTFFDFFVITWINFDRTLLPRNIYFPVRSNFFYDNIIGVLLNIVMGGCAMFPPIFRKAEKKAFNKYSMKRLAEELQRGAATIGFHPEVSFGATYAWFNWIEVFDGTNLNGFVASKLLANFRWNKFL